MVPRWFYIQFHNEDPVYELLVQVTVQLGVALRVRAEPRTHQCPHPAVNQCRHFFSVCTILIWLSIF